VAVALLLRDELDPTRFHRDDAGTILALADRDSGIGEVLHTHSCSGKILAAVVDLLIRRARLPRASSLADVAIRDGRIVAGAAEEPKETVEANGALLTPALVEPHIHLDAVLTVGQPRHNLTGSLFEGIAIWGERVKDLTLADVKARAEEVLRWQVANGVLFVRSHVDVCDPQLTALRALIELRAEVKDMVTLQLVAFPQQGILSFPDGEALMRQAVALGADVVGAIPHFELTREYGERSVKFAMELAAEHGKAVDLSLIHI